MRRHRLAVAALSGLLLCSSVPASAFETPSSPPPGSLPVQPAGTDATPQPTDRLIVKVAEGALDDTTSTTPGAEDGSPAIPEDAAETVETTVEKAVVEQTEASAEEVAPEIVSTTTNGAVVVDLGKKVEVDQLEDAAQELESDPAVEYAEPDMIVSASAMATNDPSVPSMWSLTNIDATLAWDRAAGAGQIIAVVDTGIVPHPDIKTVPGLDVTQYATASWQSLYAGSRDGNGYDGSARDEGDFGAAGTCSSTATNSSWHGTHVAGTAAATANNGIGIAGVAPQAKIMPVRALGTCGSGYASDVANGILWASGHAITDPRTGVRYGAPAKRADVINLSLNFPGVCNTTWSDAINAAHANGSIVVSAAGNYNVDAAGTSPASCLNNITVGAAGADGRRAGYSNHGWAVDLLAPGGAGWYSVFSTIDRGTAGPAGAAYGNNQGTSMASPHVAGAAAVLRELNPGLDVHQVRDILLEHSVTIDGLKHLDLNSAVKNTPRARLFTDVNPEGTFAREMHYMKRTGILNGWSDGTYRPGNTMSRWEMAAALYRMAGSPAFTAPAVSPFADVPTSHTFYKEIAWMHASGISTGWNTNGVRTYQPNSYVTRGQMAAFLYRAAGKPTYSAPATSPFTDVRTTQDFYKEMSWMKAKGISTGWSDGTYRPGANTARDQMAAFLFRFDWHNL